MIRKVGSGPRPWRARAYDVDGKEKQRSFATKKAAEEWKRTMGDRRARVDAGMPAPSGPITLEGLVNVFFANRRARKSDHWLRMMLKSPLERFGTMRVRAIRPEDVGAWLHNLNLSPKTKTHIIGALRQVLDAGIEWGYLERNPARARAVDTPGTQRKRPMRPFESWHEVCAVAEQAGLHHLDTAGVSDALIRFACSTGLRPGEWLALTPAHVDRETRTLHVPGTKTENAQRIVPLSGLALAALADIPWPLDKDKPLFPIDYEQWRANVWPAALKGACVSHRTPYEMRHTFATLALEARVPIESLTPLMGHANFQTTYKHYAKFTRRRLDQDVALLDALASVTPTSEEEAQ